MAKKKKETKEENSLMVTGDRVPDYLKTEEGKERGSENVGIDDLVIPRIELVQDLSPCLKTKYEDKYIPGSEVGMLFNSVTRKLYPETVLFVPVLFRKEWLIWIDRDTGGGFRGSFPSAAEAAKQIETLEAEDKKLNKPKVYEAIDTAQHIILVLLPDGNTEQAVISMSKSKMKVSRNFNSVVRLNGGDRFSRIYELTSVSESGDKGDYENFHIKTKGFPSEALYKKAEKLYMDIKDGVIKAKVHDEFDQDIENNDKQEPAGDKATTDF